MTGSAHHELSKWLANLLQPVLDRYTVHCISDSFTFADYIRKLDGQIDSFFSSFDVSSLFTNVPLHETIAIHADTLYNNSDSQPRISKKIFVELLHCAASRESNRLKYRSVSGSGSRNFIFNGSVSVQVRDFSKIWIQIRFGFSCTKI